MTSGFKNGMRDLMNFHTSGQNCNSSVVFNERKVFFGQGSSSTFNIWTLHCFFKVAQIPRVMFETGSQFFFKFCTNF